MFIWCTLVNETNEYMGRDEEVDCHNDRYPMKHLVVRRQRYQSAPHDLRVGAHN
jgi:hypothetical protein